MELCRAHLNVLDTRCGFRDWLAVLPLAVYVKFDCLFDEPQNFVPGFRSGDAPRQIRNVSPKTGFTFFNDYGRAHLSYSLSAQADKAIPQYEKDCQIVV